MRGHLPAQAASTGPTFGDVVDLGDEPEPIAARAPSSLRLPLSGHPLRLGDLIGRHLRNQIVASFRHVFTECSVILPRRCQIIPHVSLHVILRHTLSGCVYYRVHSEHLSPRRSLSYSVAGRRKRSSTSQHMARRSNRAWADP